MPSAHTVFLHLAFAALGAVAYALVGSVMGVETPIWWEGKALFPLYLSLAALFVGALPFQIGISVYLGWRNLVISTTSVAVAGFILGLIIYPTLRFVSPLLSQTAAWNTLDPILGALILLGFAWIISAIITSMLVVAFAAKKQK
jgi:hypothetical protein